MRERKFVRKIVLAAMIGLGLMAFNGVQAGVIFSENFDGLALTDSVDEGVEGPIDGVETAYEPVGSADEGPGLHPPEESGSESGAHGAPPASADDRATKEPTATTTLALEGASVSSTQNGVPPETAEAPSEEPVGPVEGRVDALALRCLSREGRLVVGEEVGVQQRGSRGGRALEFLGTYDPKVDPALIKLDHAGIQAWVDKGAQLSDTVRSLLKQSPAPSEGA